jgi:hypothetical protein
MTTIKKKKTIKVVSDSGEEIQDERLLEILKQQRQQQEENNDSTMRTIGRKILPALMALVLSLSINFFKARLKERGFFASPKETVTLTASSLTPQIQKPFNSEERFQERMKTLHQKQAGGGTRITSNFLQDADLLKQLSDPQLWQTCFHTNQNTVQWMDVGATPTNIWEELAVKIWEHHPLIQNQSLAGYEYWCNIVTPESPLEWHVDKDEVVLEESTGGSDEVNEAEFVLSTPYMGAVYYGFPHAFTGGYLELFPYSPHQVPDPTDLADLHDHVERFRADYNRLIILNVSEWHRVSPVTSGARYTLAVNVWKERPKSYPAATADDEEKKHEFLYNHPNQHIATVEK